MIIEKVPHFPYPDGYNELDPVKQTMNDISDVIKEGSYLFYEFEDCTIEVPLDVEAGTTNPGYYTRHISPLFYHRVMDNEKNWGLIDILTEEVPFYYMEPYGVFNEDDILLSATRDIGVTNVPSPLQDNDFWMVWFRDAIGFVKNSMILDVYNKMRYPYIFENQYLNARIFNRLSNYLFNDIGDSEARIGFKTSEEENAEVYDPEYKFYGHEVGCLDYMEDIIEKKVNSTYSFIDYNPEYAGFLSDWVESQYSSGQIGYEDKKEEFLVYKLQDIKSELLRRKFAGTYTLYMLLMASIGKRGSYIGAITATETNANNKPYFDEEGNIIGYIKPYNDNRLLRVPNIPGIFTAFRPDLDKLNPISIYYEKPEEMYKIPLGTLIPLFYSSTDVKYMSGKRQEGKEEYNNELFHKALTEGSLGYVIPTDVYTYKYETFNKDEYRTNFYRDSTPIVLWDNLSGVLTQDSIIKNPDTLDTWVEETVDGKKIFRHRTLDEKTPDEKGILKYRTLDTLYETVDLSSVYGGVFDVTADDILYHRNVLQRQGDYQFVTYPIANGNGLCLMDTSWMNYLEYYSKQKSKVNEDISFGVQVSTYIDVETVPKVPYEFFSYKYEKENSSGETSIDGSVEWVYLYHNLLKYRTPAPENTSDEEKAKDFTIDSVTSTLMTRIRLKHDGDSSWYEKPGVLLSEYKEFEKFTKYNIGLIPFTYRELSDNIPTMKLGWYGGTSWYDDPDMQGLAEAYFTFSDLDLPDRRLNGEYTISRNQDSEILESKVSEHVYGINPYELEDSQFYNNYGFTSNVKNKFDDGKVKTVYFAVKRIEEGITKFSWSDPIRVFNHSLVEALVKDLKDKKNVAFHPDWAGLVYYLNPYFNFTRESASPLRHKELLKAPITYVAGSETVPAHYIMTDNLPSEQVALCNLTRMRHLDYLCIDDTENINSLPWIKGNFKGLYLKKNKASGSTGEKILIFGDNRDTSDDVIFDRIVTVNSVNDIPEIVETGVMYHVSEDNSYYYSKNGVSYKKLDFDPTREKFSDIYKDNLSVPVLHFQQVENGDQYYNVDGYSLELKEVGNSGATSIDWQNGWTICTHVNTLTESVTLVAGVTVSCGKGDHRISVSSSGVCIVDDVVSEISASFSWNGSINVLPGFEGDLYDFRIYNTAKAESELKILNAGMFRELYSYSPANYKLAHSIYVDNALIRMVDNYSDNTTTYGIKKIGAIRVFNRSVWDSIMLDMYPMSLEEANPNNPQYYRYYKNPIDDSDVYTLVYDNGTPKTYLNDCVEQTLIDNFEVFNGREVQQNTTLVHNNKRYNLVKESYVTMVLSLIQPTECKDEPIKSMNYLGFNSSNGLVSVGSVTIPMKSESSDDFFRYSADLDINFTVSPKTSLSWFMARGSNISLRYIPSIDDALTVLDNTTVKGSEKNYVLVPLCIPPQGSNSYIDRFLVSDFLLSRTISSFLRATSYYNEIRIPVPCQLTEEGYDPIYDYEEASKVIDYEAKYATTVYKWGLNSETQTYEYQTITDTDPNAIFNGATRYYIFDDNKKVNYLYNKWDAIRTLKEGEYVFTCKYPLKILPFTDAEFSNNIKDYNTLYGTMRFKVVVSGKPKSMTDEEILEYNIPKSIPEDYKSYNLEATLKNSKNRIDPKDNYTFPHREVGIDLYIYDVKSGVAGSMKEDGTEDYVLGWTHIASNRIEKAFTETFVPAHEPFDSTQDYYIKVENDWSKVSNPESDELDRYFVKVLTAKDDIVYLDKDNLDDGIVIKRKCSMFLSNNYVEAFYVDNYDRSKESSITNGSNDDDLIDPILIDKDIFSDRENLLSSLNSSSDNINKLVLLAGKSYKVLFDYTSNICEFKYQTSDDDTNPANIQNNNAEALLSKYVYTKSGEDGLEAFTSYVNKTIGYWGSNTSGVWNWKMGDTGMGNPYSGNSTENLIARYVPNAAEFYQIRYLDELKVSNEKSDGSYELISPVGVNITYHYSLNHLQAFDNNDSLRTLNVSEADIIKYHYDQIFPNSENSTNVIKDIVAQSCGLIGGFSYFEPNILTNGSPSSALFNIKLSPKALPNEGSKEDPKETLYKLCSYQVPSWRVPYTNTTSILRTAATSSENSIITSPLAEFNTNYWSYNPVGLKYNSYDWDEDDSSKSCVRVFVRDDVTDGHIRFRYNKGNNQINSVYTFSLKLKGGPTKEIREVSAHLYKGDKIVESCTMNLTRTTDDGWSIYEGSTDDPVLTESVEFDIKVTRVLGIGETEDDNYIRFKEALVKCRPANKYTLGLSETYLGSSSYDKSMIIVSHTLPMFRKTYSNDTKTVDVFIPIQFKPDLVTTNEVYRPIPGIYRAAKFIDSCAVEVNKTTSRIRYLKAPWIRRINLLCQGLNSEATFHKYGIKKNSLGTLEYKEIYSSVSDIYKVPEKEEGKDYSIVTVTPTSDREKFEITFTGLITMDLKKDGTIRIYNNNLKVADLNSIALVNERVSYTYNCFDFKRFSQGLSSYVGVTNVQLLNRDLLISDGNGAYDDREIIYELEYLPIIYDEQKNHISFNIMFNHVPNNVTSEEKPSEGTDTP